MIISNNTYQRSAYLNSTNYFSAALYEKSSLLNEFVSLKKDNLTLMEVNANLMNEIKALEDAVLELTKDSIYASSFIKNYNFQNKFILSRVIKNSIDKSYNYITLNKGLKDSIQVGMGVISINGVVGEVTFVSENFSLVQPIINMNSHYSSKLKNSNAFSSIYWDGLDASHVYMREFPSYEEVVIGDTIVTSGYSDVFPQGMIVGTVEEINLNKNTNNYDLKIKLSTNFSNVNNVMVIKFDNLKELQQLENTN